MEIGFEVNGMPLDRSFWFSIPIFQRILYGESRKWYHKQNDKVILTVPVQIDCLNNNNASIWKHPIIFVCENNYYDISCCQREMMNICEVSERSKAYGIPGETVDGNDILAVYEASSKAVEHARKGYGPVLLEFLTWRHAGHWEGDPDEWRDQEEYNAWLKKDPIKGFERFLTAKEKIHKEDLEKINREVISELEEAIRFAEKSPFPLKEDLCKDVFIESV